MSQSRFPGFYKLSIKERRALLEERFGLTSTEMSVFDASGGLSLENAGLMIENCVGLFGLPLGLGLNFVVNDTAYVVPMVVEEPSVVAAVSNSAKLVSASGGFSASADPGHMIAQIQVTGVSDVQKACDAIAHATPQLLAFANSRNPGLVNRGGGAIDIEVRRFDDEPEWLVIHLIVDCLEAMGANAVNTMAEALAPEVETLTGGQVYLRILSNLADRRLARASCSIPVSELETESMSGFEVARGIEIANRFAEIDPYRAATHNKGVMNGIDAVAIATGNDWRSIEAGAHAYAASAGRYASLTRWTVQDDHLLGSIELPMAVGTVGGSTRVHPTIKLLRELLGTTNAQELAMVMTAVGLAQNLGALRALVTDGIQKGHMALHARQTALAAGVALEDVSQVAEGLVKRGEIRIDAAKALWRQLRRPNTHD